MATQPIKTRFELDGEKEYKAAVSEINASLRVLNSEMKLVSEQFKNNDKSVEALTASSDVLSRQILTQKERIEALQAALKNSAEHYGEADARTKRWQTSLNNAQAELVKMERELKANSDAMEKNNEDLADLDEGLDTLDGGLLDTTESGKGLGYVLDLAGCGSLLKSEIRKRLFNLNNCSCGGCEGADKQSELPSATRCPWRSSAGLPRT